MSKDPYQAQFAEHPLCKIPSDLSSDNKQGPGGHHRP